MAISTEKEFLKGEVRGRFSIKEGANLINNKTGKTLDQLTETAWESGFYIERPTVPEFLDALRSDVDAKMSGTGKRIYSAENKDAIMEAELDREWQDHMNRYADVQIREGTDTEGNPTTRSAGEIMTEGKNEVQRASSLADLFNMASDCLRGGE